MSEDKDVKFYGKIAKFPKNTKAKSAYTFLENIKVSKTKLWYILIEKESDGLQVIKYNNKTGFNLNNFMIELNRYYMLNDEMKPIVEQLVIVGEDKFSTIKNIPDIEIDGKKFITILMTDLIRLLYK